MAVGYTRHGIELCRRSEAELAALFNAELSRAVRNEPKRSEAAERIISMHKRHGDVVTRVLQEKIVEQAAKLVEGTIDDSSLIAIVIGKKHLEYGRDASEAKQYERSGPAQSQTAMTSPPSAQPQNLALMNVEDVVKAVLAKFGFPAPRRLQKRRKLGKRDTVIFAAILLEYKGPRYCTFLQDHGIKPKWHDSGPPTYPKSYQTGNQWRKKVQDEKTRAKARMNRFAGSELADALNTYLPEYFDLIAPLLHTRNSQDARKTSRPASTHKHTTIC